MGNDLQYSSRYRCGRYEKVLDRGVIYVGKYCAAHAPGGRVRSARPAIRSEHNHFDPCHRVAYVFDWRLEVLEAAWAKHELGNREHPYIHLGHH